MRNDEITSLMRDGFVITPSLPIPIQRGGEKIGGLQDETADPE